MQFAVFADANWESMFYAAQPLYMDGSQQEEAVSQVRVCIMEFLFPSLAQFVQRSTIRSKDRNRLKPRRWINQEIHLT